MKTATIVAACTLCVSGLVFFVVIAVTSVFRSQGMEYWPGTGPTSNWPSIVGFTAMNLMWLSAVATALLLGLWALRRAVMRKSAE